MKDYEERDVARRTLDTDADEPGAEIAQAVAELEDKDVTDVPNMYGCMDHVLDHIFSEPPSSEAQIHISFNYEGYRITVEQGGEARFVPAE